MDQMIFKGPFQPKPFSESVEKTTEMKRKDE